MENKKYFLNVSKSTWEVGAEVLAVSVTYCGFGGGGLLLFFKLIFRTWKGLFEVFRANILGFALFGFSQKWKSLRCVGTDDTGRSSHNQIRKRELIFQVFNACLYP